VSLGHWEEVLHEVVANAEVASEARKRDEARRTMVTVKREYYKIGRLRVCMYKDI
jgi:hypothetical protein